MPDFYRELQAQTDRMLRAACAYADFGWKVFPIHTYLNGQCSCGNGRRCGNPGKHPCTPHGFKDAVSSSKVLAGWWQRWPGANVGIACGEDSGGLLVVDLDGAQGVAEWDALTIENETPRTLTARTGGGGMHLYFLSDAGLGNSRWKLGPHVDTRGTGGYVLAPPSTHASGESYAWITKDVRPAPLPAWALEALKPRHHTPIGEPRLAGESSSYGTAALRNSLERVRLAVEGVRNETLNDQCFSVGQLIGGGEIDPRGVAEAFLHVSPDPDRVKSEQTIQRALRDGANHPKRRDDR